MDKKMCAAIQLSLLLLLILCSAAARSDQEGATVGLQMIHRSSPRSPSWKPHYSNPINLLHDLIRKDRHRLESFRRRFLQDDNSPVFPSAAKATPPLNSEEALVASRLVSGSSVGNGEYFAELQVGTPPQKFSLIVDTGSDLTWIQCSPPNKTLTPPPPTYNRSSSSFKPIPCTANECTFVPAPAGSVCSRSDPKPCDYTYGYSDQSRATGILGYDTVHMKLKRTKKKPSPYSGTSKTHARIENVAIGCGLEVSGSSFVGASGVLGLGHGPVSFPSQVGKIFGGIFSYCLVNYLAPGGANVSSELLFGRPRRGFPGMKYTPIVRNPVVDGFYYVDVVHLEVNRKVVEGTESRLSWSIDKDGNGGTIFDSGTTLSFFREPAYSLLMEAVKRSIRLPRAGRNLRGFELCYNVSSVTAEEEKAEVGEFSVVFHGGAVLRAPPNNFLVLVDKDVKCVSIKKTDGFNVIGNLLQQDFRVEYDLAKSRIGLKWSPCSKS